MAHATRPFVHDDTPYPLVCLSLFLITLRQLDYMEAKLTLIPEWEPQDLVLITWPHAESDWADMLDEVEACYREMARAILRFEDLLILAHDENYVKQIFEGEHFEHRLRILEMPSNDTWCRDYAPLAFRVSSDEGTFKAIADFTFNGWGMKFAANKDNLISRCLYLSRVFADDVSMMNRLMCVLEGGGVESDGQGTILSTYGCIYEPNRNAGFDEEELSGLLAEVLGAERLIMLRNGELEGDDTDGHIDTLARFVTPDTIAYVKCLDPRDGHYHALERMEQELLALRTTSGEPYKLIPLPLPKAIYDEDGHRLPATYANFLFVNGGLLVPTYDQDYDNEVLKALGEALPDRQIVGVDCQALIRQHGSLHCATMQIPEGFINQNKWEL